MRALGWLALGAFLVSGCVTLEPSHLPGSTVANPVLGSGCDGKITACGSRGESVCAILPRPDLPSRSESAKSTSKLPVVSAPAITDPSGSMTRPDPPPVKTQSPPVAVPAPAPAPSAIEAAVPRVEEDSAERRVVTLARSSTTTPPVGATDLPEESLEPQGSPPIIEPEILHEAGDSPKIGAKIDAVRPVGRPVASVGDEVITLPELTDAVKTRLKELGPAITPGRRQMIALSRSVLKSMIVHSLIFQEAEEKLGGREGLAMTVARINRAWDAEELPSVLRRESLTNVDELRKKLGPGMSSPESLREEFVARSLAKELMRLEGSVVDFDSYLNALRRRRSITSIMSPAELAVAGRNAALSTGNVR